MSDKERLEEMKNSCLEGLHILFGTSWVSMPKENFNWLIEQAEKVEKYREALEFYANEKSWMNREVTILMDGEPTDVEDCPAIFDDGGNIARKALEGEE